MNGSNKEIPENYWKASSVKDFVRNNGIFAQCQFGDVPVVTIMMYYVSDQTLKKSNTTLSAYDKLAATLFEGRI